MQLLKAALSVYNSKQKKHSFIVSLSHYTDSCSRLQNTVLQTIVHSTSIIVWKKREKLKPNTFTECISKLTQVNYKTKS